MLFLAIYFKPAKALDVDDNTLIEQNILYAIEQTDNDKMSEHDKALFFGVYTQVGNYYSFKTLGQTYGSVFVDHASVCAGFNDAFRLLNTTAGSPCEVVMSIKGNHAWNLCNLDDEWTYFDSTKSGSQLTRIGFSTVFKSKSDVMASGVSSMLNFSDAMLRTNNFLHSFPEGKTSTKDYSTFSQTYYTDTDKYYIDAKFAAGWTSALYKENLTTGSKQKLVDVLYDSFNTGLVKDGNILYYVGTDKSLYSMDITNNKIQKLIPAKSSSTVNGVYSKDGNIYYSTIDSNEDTEEHELSKLNDWSVVGYYDVANENYKLKYIESKKNVAIVGAIGKDDQTPSGTLVLPDMINNKPVIGIGINAFYESEFSGELKLPSHLKYIGNSAFAYSKKFDTTLKLPETLKSIGYNAFIYVPIKGSLIIPNSVGYIGYDAFDENNLTSLKLSENLKYISDGAFAWNRDLSGVIEIPSKVEYIGKTSFAYTSIDAVIIPKSVKEIYSDAFKKNWEGLEEIIIESPNIDYMGFTDTESTIYLPENTKTATYAKNNNISYKDLISKVTFANKEITGNKGDIIDLSYTLTPKYYYPDKLIWNSSNKQVATVENGKVKLLSKGQTEISVKTISNVTSTIKVNVTDIKLTLNQTNYQINNLNDSLQLKAKLSNGEDINVTWSTDYNDILSVNNGLVKALKGGFAHVTATSKEYGSASCLVYVSVPVKLSDGSKQYVGDINKDGKFDKTDSDEILELYKSGATQDDLLIADLDHDGKVSSTDATLFNSFLNYSFTPGTYKPILNVKLNKDTLSLKINEEATLAATINPKDTTDSEKLTWKSSNKSIASVDEKGKITGLSDGVASITVTTSNGKTATCKVTVGTGVSKYIKGDLNKDTKVDTKDAMEALYIVVGKSKQTGDAILIGDLDNSNSITTNDAIEILRIYLRKA